MDPTSDEFKRLLDTLPPSPFVQVMSRNAPAPNDFRNPSVFSIGGRPYAAALRKPQDAIIFINLTTEAQTLLYISPREGYGEYVRS